MRKFTILAMALVASIWARPAAADDILFDLNASGNPILTNVLDWAPGNTELIEQPGVGGAPTTATILYQANLGTSYLTTAGTNTQTNGTGGGADFITVTALLTGVETSPGSGIFLIQNGGVISVYADTTAGNDLAGTGFNDGTLILTAVTSGLPAFGSALFVNPGPTTTLDGFNGDSYSGTQTFLLAAGSLQPLQATVTSAPNAYFTNIITNITLTFTDGSNTIPYTQVDPAAQFFNGSPGVATNGICGPFAVGPLCVNGSQNTLMVQSDVATSFQNPSAPIPEPATLTLLGVGLLGASVARRRQQKNKK